MITRRRSLINCLIDWYARHTFELYIKNYNVIS